MGRSENRGRCAPIGTRYNLDPNGLEDLLSWSDRKRDEPADAVSSLTSGRDGALLIHGIESEERETKTGGEYRTKGNVST